MNDPETFLILEPQTLVQMDLAQSILEICPGARILRAASVEGAEDLLGQVQRLSGAIVGVGVPAFKKRGTHRRTESRGAWIICLNGLQTDYILAEGWHPLSRPFSSDDATRLIRSLIEERRSAPAAS